MYLCASSLGKSGPLRCDRMIIYVKLENVKIVSVILEFTSEIKQEEVLLDDLVEVENFCKKTVIWPAHTDL